jgi:uncharacterized membrane protein
LCRNCDKAATEKQRNQKGGYVSINFIHSFIISVIGVMGIISVIGFYTTYNSYNSYNSYILNPMR